MTKSGLIKAVHVRNEQFIDELKSIMEPLVLLWQIVRIQATCPQEATDDETVKKVSQIEALLAKLVLDRLEPLLETWPNAVWFFFPEN